jgi:hypothetical protein
MWLERKQQWSELVCELHNVERYIMKIKACFHPDFTIHFVNWEWQCGEKESMGDLE